MHKHECHEKCSFDNDVNRTQNTFEISSVAKDMLNIQQ